MRGNMTSYEALHNEVQALQQRVTELEQTVRELKIYQLFFEQAPMPVVIFRSDGLAVAMNDQNEVFINTPRTSVVGVFNINEDPESSQKGYLEQFQRSLQGETARMPPTAYNTAQTCLDGRGDDRVVWSETTYVPLCNGDGNIAYIGEVNLDVTERMQAELARQKSEERYRLLAEHAPDIIFRYRLGPTPGYEYINSAVTTLLGYPPEAFYADPYFALRITHSDYHTLVCDLTLSPKPSQEPTVIRYFHKNGRDVWLELRQWIVLDEEGTPVAIEGVSRDVTERVHAAEALRKSHDELEQRVRDRTQELFQSVKDLFAEAAKRKQAEETLQLAQFSLDRSADGVAWYDRDGNHWYVNDAMCRLTGFPRERLLEMTVWDLDPNLTREQWDTHWDTLREQGSTTYETYQPREDGSTCPVEVTVTWVSLPHRDYLCWFIRDITERNRAREELERRVDERTRMLQQAAAHALQELTRREQAEKALQQAHDELEQRVEARTAELARANQSLQEEITEHQQAQQALRESEERFRLVALATREAIYDWDIRANRVWWNDAYRQLFSVDVGKNPFEGDWWLRRLHPREREAVLASFQAALASREHVWADAYRFRHSDGTYAILDVRCYIARDEQGNAVREIGSVTDMTRHRWAEARQATQLAVTRILTESDTIDEAIPRLLRVICQGLEWQVGELWQFDPSANLLHCSHFWSIPGLESCPFVQMLLTLTFVPGEGLPGRVWAEGQAVWISEIAANPFFFRSAEAGQAGLHESLAFTVGIGAEAKGVLCFFSYDRHPESAALSDMMADIGTQVSQFLSRKWAEDALRQERGLLAQRVAERTAELSIANAELARAVRTKDEFLANMSHELRTPLNAILGLTESLEEGVYGPLNERHLKSLRTIGGSGRHLLALINDILDLSKIEAGKMDLQIGPVPIDLVCQASLQFIKQQAMHKQVRVTFNLDTSLTRIQADERRLKQILINLLNNAVKFTPEQGEIGLEVVTEGENEDDAVVRFTVWDTGIGIAPEHLGELFKPFVQIDSGLARLHEGTGLGLALVSRLTELQGGSVAVESQPGAGSRFTVSLPLRQAGQTESPAEELDHSVPCSPASASIPLSSARVLLAEDNESTLTLLTEYLSARGYQVVVARNGAEAVEQTLRERPDLILMDIQMPGMDGLEAIRSIRASEHDGLATLPIIALTALAMPGDRERCLEAGAHDYLSKPVNLKTLIRTIEAHLGAGHRR
ncbi:MAG: PAS domain S-box protein [Chloroflexaceae bacterium]|nr:PAS domain S-box protein [Chloroflexaceae bacterium]